MGTIVEDNLATLDAGRQILVDVGLRPTRVWIRSGAWSGGEVHLGNLTNTDTEITPRPKVEWIGRRLKVHKITPDFTIGGWAPNELSPEMTASVNFYFVVQFKSGALQPFRLDSIDTTKAFGYALLLEPLDVPTPDEYP